MAVLRGLYGPHRDGLLDPRRATAPERYRKSEALIEDEREVDESVQLSEPMQRLVQAGRAPFRGLP